MLDEQQVEVTGHDTPGRMRGRTLRSADADTRTSSEGWKAMEPTIPRCASKVNVSLPATMSQSCSADSKHAGVAIVNSKHTRTAHALTQTQQTPHPDTASPSHAHPQHHTQATVHRERTGRRRQPCDALQSSSSPAWSARPTAVFNRNSSTHSPAATQRTQTWFGTGSHCMRSQSTAAHSRANLDGRVSGATAAYTGIGWVPLQGYDRASMGWDLGCRTSKVEDNKRRDLGSDCAQHV